MYRARFVIKTMAVLALLTLFPQASPARMDPDESLSRGETVYVPIYSNVYSGPKAKPFLLAAMISIRNVDPKNDLTITRADYYDSNGRRVEGYLNAPVSLKPLASTYLYIKEHDTRGGPGASFLVNWRSDKWVNQPIIEGVMLGLSSGQGVSFICPGRILVKDRD